MITSHPVAYDVDIFAVSVRIFVLDESGSGIKRIRVRDRFGIFFAEQDFNCPESGVIDVGRVENDRFPIFVEGLDCEDRVTPADEPLPLLPPGSTDTPGIRLPCSPTYCPPNPGCNEAERQLIRARNEVLERCSEVSAIRSRRDSLLAAAAVMLAAAIAFTAIAAAVIGIPIVGQILFAAFFGIAALLFGLAIGLAVAAWLEQQKLDEAQRRLQEARRRFTDAADNVSRACCSQCITVDLIQPECS
jgi:hypothetical protein